MTIRDLTTKVANNGANVNGKLTAEEYNVLITQVKNMSNGAVYMGIATPTTAPQTYDGNVDLVYIASQSGKYANFGNIVVNDGEICALHWQHSTGWSKEVIPTLLSTKVDKVDGKGLSTNDYTNADKAQVAENKANIATKQDKLSVSLKGNGNIVINNLEGGAKEFMPATPSGDPMHYAYAAVGAVWNANTKYWELNTLTDITSEQMRKIYNLGFLNLTSMSLGSSTMSNVRTNLGRTGRYNFTQVASNIITLAYGNEVIEVINLTSTTANATNQNNAGIVILNGLNNAFYGCKNLRMIYGRMSITKVDAYYTQNTFYGCTALEEVRIDTLSSLSFADSPNLSKASILYLVQNSMPTTAITITLHPTAYAMAKGDSGIQSDLASNPNITLISA